MTKDTIVNKELQWKVKKPKKVHRRAIRRVHTHVNHLTSKHITYQVLVPTTISVGSVTSENVFINYMTSESVIIGKLITECSSRRIMLSTKASANTLTWTNVSYRKVKKVIESVNQSLKWSSKCVPTHCGQNYGDLNGCGGSHTATGSDSVGHNRG